MEEEDMSFCSADTKPKPAPNLAKTSQGIVGKGLYFWMAKTSACILYDTANSRELTLGKAAVSQGHCQTEIAVSSGTRL